MLTIYKSGQGVWLRRISLIGVLGVGLFSSVAFYGSIRSAAGVAGKKYLGFIPIEWAGRPLMNLKFGGFEITPAFLMGIGMFVLAGYLAFYLSYRRAGTGDFLIETEKEMRKVSWPTWIELKGSSIVVVVVTFFLGCYLLAVDVVLSKILGIFFR